MDEAVFEFLRARQRLADHNRRTGPERSEAASAKRALSGLLCDSMQRNGLTCVAVDGGYVRLTHPRTPLRLRTDAEVIAIVDDLCPDIEGVTDDQVPEVVWRAILRRTRAAPTGTAHAARVSFASTIPKRLLPVAAADVAAETRTIVHEYARAHRARCEVDEGAAPLRAARRDLERAAIAAAARDAQGPVVVRMERAGAKHQVLRVEHRTRTSNPVGLRNVLKHVRGAASVAARNREAFDQVFQAELLRRVHEESGAAGRAYLRVGRMATEGSKPGVAHSPRSA